MLTDEQSLILCGIIAASIFITGILDILDNIFVLALLTLAFLAILINLFIWKHPIEAEEEEEEEEETL